MPIEYMLTSNVDDGAPSMGVDHDPVVPATSQVDWAALGTITTTARQTFRPTRR